MSEFEIDEFIYNNDKFINDRMVNIITGTEQQIEDLQEQAVAKAIAKFAVYLNEDKVKQWLNKCAVLDKIEENKLIDIAVSKRIRQLKEQNDILKEENKILKQKIEKLINEIANQD